MRRRRRRWPRRRARRASRRPPGDDVDDAIDGVGAPHRTGRAVQHLDALDGVQRHALGLPDHARVERRIDAAPVHQHQQLVGIAAGEAARRDAPARAGQLRHVEPGHQAQGLGQVARAAAADVVRRDHVHGRGHLAEVLRLARGRHHLDAHQVFEREVGQLRAVAPEAWPASSAAARAMARGVRREAGRGLELMAGTFGARLII